MKYTIFGKQKNLQKFTDKMEDYIQLLGEINLEIVEIPKSPKIKNNIHTVNPNHGVIFDSTDGYVGPTGHNGSPSPIGSLVGSSGTADIKPKNKKVVNHLYYRTLYIFNNYEELNENSDLIQNESICLCLTEMKCYFRVHILIKENSNKFIKEDNIISFIEIKDNKLQYFIPATKVDKKITNSLRLDLFLDSYSPEKRFKFIDYKFLLAMKTQDLKSFKDKLNDYEKAYANIKDNFMSFTNPLEAESATEIYVNILNQIVTEIVDLYSLVTETSLIKISTQEDIDKLDKLDQSNDKDKSVTIYDSVFGKITYQSSFLNNLTNGK